MCESSHHPQLNTVVAGRRPRRIGAGPVGSTGPSLVLLGLLLLTLLLAGCTVTPVVAGEAPVMPVPVGNEQVIAIAPSSAESGVTVAVAGAGWLPNEMVYVNLEGMMDGVPLESTMVMTSTDGEGRFTTEFVTPIDLFWQGATDLRVAAYSLDKARSASTPRAVSTRPSAAQS